MAKKQVIVYVDAVQGDYDEDQFNDHLERVIEEKLSFTYLENRRLAWGGVTVRETGLPNGPASDIPRTPYSMYES